ncbi:MAG TPA: PilW family protein [Steroidobacteraceae bacterium]|nr:PilW family protein [Steroidobacteraceae bacterium]
MSVAKTLAARQHTSCVGAGLVELMVALVIGAFLLSASATAYLGARNARAQLDAGARLQEIARYAMALIEADVRMAGYWGLTNRADDIAAHPSLAFPAKCGGKPWVTSATQFVAGTNNAYLAVPSCAALSGGAQPGSDVLVVRRASAQRIAPQKATVGSPDQDRVLVVSSHASGTVFVPQDLGNQIPASYATTDVAGLAPQADTRALVVDAYYVSRGSSTAADFPALRRKTLTAGPDIGDEEVIAGVEDLQFQVGVDTDADPGADVYLDPGMLPTGARIVSVRIWLRLCAPDRGTALATQRIGPYGDRAAGIVTDTRLRLLVSRTVYLRNSGS